MASRTRKPKQAGAELEQVFAASAGFHGDKLRGSVVLAGQPRVFARLYPFPTADKQPDLVDWARELTKQAVGRFKDRLLAYGLAISIGTPQVMRAEDLRVARTRKLVEIPMAIEIEDMRLDALLDFDVGPGFELADQPVSSKGPAVPEGSVVLF